MHKEILAVVIVAGTLLLILAGRKGWQHGFYTADYAEYGNTNDWYVASNAGVGGA